MKRQRVRSEVYRARRFKLKASRRQRRDPDAQKGNGPPPISIPEALIEFEKGTGPLTVQS